eukprot:6269027-Amphidinium_carterae.1
MPDLPHEATARSSCTSSDEIPALSKLYSAEGAWCANLHKMWSQDRGFKSGPQQTQSIMLGMPR